MLISRTHSSCAREPLDFVWRNSRFNIGISDYNTEEGLSPKRLLIFSFLTLKIVFQISLLWHFLVFVIFLHFLFEETFASRQEKKLGDAWGNYFFI